MQRNYPIVVTFTSGATTSQWVAVDEESFYSCFALQLKERYHNGDFKEPVNPETWLSEELLAVAKSESSSEEAEEARITVGGHERDYEEALEAWGELLQVVEAPTLEEAAALEDARGANLAHKVYQERTTADVTYSAITPEVVSEDLWKDFS